MTHTEISAPGEILGRPSGRRRGAPRKRVRRAWIAAAAVALALVSSAYGQSAASWSPETATLAYTRRVDGDAEIFLRAGIDGPEVRLTDAPGADLGVAWSPDGSRVFFHSLRDGNREIYAMDADGGNLVNLTRDPAQDLLADVSPDGSRIAYFSDRDLPEHPPTSLPGHLYVLPVSGGEARRVTAEPLISTFGPDWSPDGGSLLFARAFGDDIDLVILDLASGRERRLPGTPAAEYGGRFSPDGRRIAFHAVISDQEARLVVMDVDGSHRREISSGGQHYSPEWSPDGRWLVFSGAPPNESQFDVLMVPAAGGEIRPLVATEVDERYAAWRPR